MVDWAAHARPYMVVVWYGPSAGMVEVQTIKIGLLLYWQKLVSQDEDIQLMVFS